NEDGTAAFGMADQVAEAEKRRRRSRLMAAARDVTLASNQQMIGSQLEVLIEGRPEDGSAWYAGRSYRDAPEVDGLVLVRADELPREVLGVPLETLQRHGSVSAEVAEAMARGVRRLAGADLGLAATGIAGPGGATELKPVGLAFVAAVSAERSLVRAHHWQGD